MSENNHNQQRLRNEIFITTLFIILGLLIVITIATHEAINKQVENSNQELINYIEAMETETSDLEQEIIATREAIEAIHSEYAESESRLNLLNNTLNQLNLQAGYTDVTGKGIIITLNDNTVGAELAKKNNPATYNAENYIVHDKDLLYIIKALAADAEAISINGILIVDSSSIRCVGTVIMVNSSRIAPPYEILIIGDQDKLMESLYASSRYITLVYKEIPITAVPSDNITISAYKGSYSTNLSTLVRDDSVVDDK